MSKSIKEIFDLRSSVDGKYDNFGIEIELENINIIHHCKGWTMEHDGSLRDRGVEFMFTHPVRFKGVLEELTNLKDYFENDDIHPIASVRTSSHIHIDVRDLNIKQLLHLISIIMIFEKDIALNSGKDRFNNLYALGSNISDVLYMGIINIKDDLAFKEFIKDCSRNKYRYSGINYSSICKFGSLELRYLGGKVDPTEVFEWVNFYNNIKKYVLEDIDFYRLFNNIFNGSNEYLIDILQPPFIPDMDNMILGSKNAQDIIYNISTEELLSPNKGDGINNYYNINL